MGPWPFFKEYVVHFTFKYTDKIEVLIRSFSTFPQIQTMVESLKLSITDQQLPMFIRILELIIALYYGEIGGQKEGDGEERPGAVREPGALLPGKLGRKVTI